MRHIARIVLLVLAFGVFTVAGHGADRVYVVQKGDTLSGIANRHKVTVKQLAQHNKLAQPDKITVGQKLAIPRDTPELDPELKTTLDKVRVPAKRWRYIVIHHSGSASGSAKAFDRYHREERRMENGLAYHFVIGNGFGMKDGELVAGQRWTSQLDGGHLATKALNQKSLGICLVGNFDESEPTDKQMEALYGLIDYLRARCHLNASAVRTHQGINPIHTRCPGRNFPTKAFFKRVKGGAD